MEGCNCRAVGRRGIHVNLEPKDFPMREFPAIPWTIADIPRSQAPAGGKCMGRLAGQIFVADALYGAVNSAVEKVKKDAHGF